MLNVCILMGRLVHTPRIKELENGKKILKFTLAINQSREKAHFIDCVSWDMNAQFICDHFARGDPLIIRGRLETRNYKNKLGNQVKVTEVIVENVNFCISNEVKNDDEDEELSMPF